MKQAVDNRDIEYIQIVNRKGNLLTKAGLLPDHLLNKDRAVYEGRPFTVAQKITELGGPLHGSGHIFDIYVPIAHEDQELGGFFSASTPKE